MVTSILDPATSKKLYVHSLQNFIKSQLQLFNVIAKKLISLFTDELLQISILCVKGFEFELSSLLSDSQSHEETYITTCMFFIKGKLNCMECSNPNVTRLILYSKHCHIRSKFHLYRTQIIIQSEICYSFFFSYRINYSAQ